MLKDVGWIEKPSNIDWGVGSTGEEILGLNPQFAAMPPVTKLICPLLPF